MTWIIIARFDRPFDRVAYFVELQDQNGNNQDIFVSMDAFTKHSTKIGVPYFGSGEYFQQNVKNMDVFSNVGSIVTGTGLSGGNIEFWPNNYAQNNSANVPNASSAVFDFGDQPTDPADGYGSMQVHNHDARQTLFAINHWSEGCTRMWASATRLGGTRTGHLPETRALTPRCG